MKAKFVCAVLFSILFLAGERSFASENASSETNNSITITNEIAVAGEIYLPEISPYADILGVYVGAIEGGGEKSETIFYEESGNLVGVYFMHIDDIPIQGFLKNITVDDQRVMNATWIDAWGSGSLQVQFSKDFTSFEGFWMPPPDAVDIPLKLFWNGSKK